MCLAVICCRIGKSTKVGGQCLIMDVFRKIAQDEVGHISCIFGAVDWKDGRSGKDISDSEAPLTYKYLQETLRLPVQRLRAEHNPTSIFH